MDKKHLEDYLFNLTHRSVSRKERKEIQKDLKQNKSQIESLINEIESKGNYQYAGRLNKTYKTYFPSKSYKKSFSLDTDHNVAKWVGYGLIGLILAGVIWAGYEFWQNRENIVKILSRDYAKEFQEDPLEK